MHITWKFSFIIWIILFVKCGSIDRKRPNQVYKNQLEKVEIRNKTKKSQNYPPSEKILTITDKKRLNQISDQINKMEETKEYIFSPGNYGGLELSCYYSNEDKEIIQLIYSRYDGTVLYTYNPTISYKNDSLDILITSYLIDSKIGRFRDTVIDRK